MTSPPQRIVRSLMALRPKALFKNSNTSLLSSSRRIISRHNAVSAPFNFSTINYDGLGRRRNSSKFRSLSTLSEADTDTLGDTDNFDEVDVYDIHKSKVCLQELLEFDKNHIWHPYTSLTEPLPVYPVASAHSNYLVLDNDTNAKLIDGMSSWWCAVHGYGHPYLNKAMRRQISRMSHVMFGGVTHRPAMELCHRLVDITPGKNLNRIFLCDSGSVSVEVALKMALQYHMSKSNNSNNNSNTTKTKIMTPLGGYHGDTFGAMSVCDPTNGMHHVFRSTLAPQIFLEKPSTPFGSEDLHEEDVRNLEEAFSLHSDKAAAFVLEPIVQGAGGMRVYSPLYLKKVSELCKKHDVLLIADEIATGFGRTGKLFACDWADVVPDILCVGKALTGGTMTGAATLCTEEVAETVCGKNNNNNTLPGVLMHGPTFMANPLACNVALASIELLLNNGDWTHGSDQNATPLGTYNKNPSGMTWETTVKGIERTLEQELMPLIDHERVKDVRVLGAIGVVECHDSVDVAAIQRFFVNGGVWIRPFAKLIYIMPPFITGTDDLKVLCATIRHSLDVNDHFVG